MCQNIQQSSITRILKYCQTKALKSYQKSKNLLLSFNNVLVNCTANKTVHLESS